MAEKMAVNECEGNRQSQSLIYQKTKIVVKYENQQLPGMVSCEWYI